MFGFFFRSLRRSILSVLDKRICKYTIRPYQAKTTVAKDATIFYHDRRIFFRVVGIASCSQCLFWIYLAHFQYTTRPQLLAGLAEKEKLKGTAESFKSEHKIWKIVTLIERSPVFLSVFAVSVGMFISATGWIYCLRNVNRIVLLSGGRKVLFVTHTPLGGTRSFKTLVEHVSSRGFRADNKSQIALKLKGYQLFFIVDKEGTFVQPSLFDSVIAVNRRI